MIDTTTVRDRLRSIAARAAEEVAEGVISTAIAVLILAFVGAGMYVGFQALSDSGCDVAAGTLNEATGGNASCDG